MVLVWCVVVYSWSGVSVTCDLLDKSNGPLLLWSQAHLQCMHTDIHMFSPPLPGDPIGCMGSTHGSSWTQEGER